MTMDELIERGYCFFIGRTIVKPNLVFCTIRDVRGDTVVQARAMTATEAIAEAIATMGKPVLAPAKPAMPVARTEAEIYEAGVDENGNWPAPAAPRTMPGMPTMPAARPTMPGMPQPKGTN